VSHVIGQGFLTVIFIGFYIGKSVAASAYGAAGSLVVVIAWIYYSALLLYFGAEFTRVSRARWIPKAAERTQSMLDVRLAAQGKPAVAAFFREHGFSSDYFPRIASRSSRIRRRKKYHNQGKQHMSEIAMPDIWVVGCFEF
jgi:hypothetical protein